MLTFEQLVLGNGAGSIKTVKQVERASRSSITRVTVGSITKEPRAGNIGDVYYFHSQEWWSLNSLGLPNPGIEAYDGLWPEMLAMAHGSGKQLWASISPFSPQECGEMTDRLLCAGLDGVEVNGSCPNVKRKVMPALHPEAAAELLRVTRLRVGNLSQVSFKLSPTRDVGLLGQLAKVLREYKVEQLVCCNTIPSQERVRADGRPALSFRYSESDPTLEHKGGLAGSAAIEESLFVVDVMRNLLPQAEIIGSGGVFGATNAKRYLDLGCVGVQSTTGYLEFKERLFEDILMQLDLAA